MIKTIDQEIDAARFGGKAASLSFLKLNGFDVPDAFAISVDIANDFFNRGILSPEVDAEIREQLTKMPSAVGYMVRSSALGEDGGDSSFAGQLSSFISSSLHDDVLNNVSLCLHSFNNENVKAYQQSSGKKLAGMAVIVQRLVQPEFAGVTFSRAPDKFGYMLTEYVKGHAEKLVSGDVNPSRVYYSLSTKKQSGDTLVLLEQVFEKTRAIESLYKCAVDIEWVIEADKVAFVQTRPITTTTAGRPVYWSNTNINENYPEPVSPLLYSIARDSYYYYYRNLARYFHLPHEDMRALEPDFSNIIGSFGGRLYYNMQSIHTIFSASPFPELLIKSFDNFVGYEGTNKNVSSLPSFKRKASFVWHIFKADRQLEKQVRAFEQIADNYNALAQNAIHREDVKACFHQFLEIRMHSWYRASLADFFAMIYHGLLGKFSKKYYGTEHSGIHNQLIQAIPGLISTQPVVAMHHLLCAIREEKTLYNDFANLPPVDFLRVLKSPAHKKTADLMEDYLQKFGFRCSGELMLTEDTYCDRPELFIALMQSYDKMAQGNPSALIKTKYLESQQIKKAFIKRIILNNRFNFIKSLVDTLLLRWLIRKASTGIAARERVRLKQALLYYRFKKTVERCGEYFVISGLLEKREDVFYLRHKEISENLSASDPFGKDLKELVKARRASAKEAGSKHFPDDFYTEEGVYMWNPMNEESSAIDSDVIKGLIACGGRVEGTARVLNSIHEAGRLRKGDILITRQTDPGWVVVFPLISGLVVERGGMLSHGAIVSREFGIPAIVGVTNATSRIVDGSKIILDANRGIITLDA